jgi:hypothetical protein
MNAPSTMHRPLVILFAAGGAAVIVLLLLHPHPHVRTFAEAAEFEARHRLIDEIVHGGAIAALLVLLAGHIALPRTVRGADLSATLAATAFGGGCALLIASLVLDGFVSPALALQYRATPDLTAQHSIEALERFCGTCIRTLMPMALLAFAASALAWCRALLVGSNRLAGAMSGFIGGVVLVLVSTAGPAVLSHAVLASLFLVASWQLVLAFAVSRTDAAVAGR